MKVKIFVTQEDIDNGIPEDESLCAISLSLLRAVPESIYLRSTPSRLIVSPYGFRVEAIATHEVVTFINRFDNKQPVHPFTFEVDFK